MGDAADLRSTGEAIADAKSTRARHPSARSRRSRRSVLTDRAHRVESAAVDPRRARKEASMTRFLVTYHGQGMPDDPAMMEQAKAAFGAWVGEAGDAIVDPGAPLHMVRQVASGQATAPAEIGGYSIIEADSTD